MNNEQRILTIQQRLQQALNPSVCHITDDSHKHIGHAGAASGAGHFSLEIASPQFMGQSRLACHRLIYTLLDDLIPEEIHALKIKIVTTPSSTD